MTAFAGLPCSNFDLFEYRLRKLGDIILDDFEASIVFPDGMAAIKAYCRRRGLRLMECNGLLRLLVEARYQLIVTDQEIYPWRLIETIK